MANGLLGWQNVLVVRRRRGLEVMNSISVAVITSLDEVGEVTALWVSVSAFVK